MVIINEKFGTDWIVRRSPFNQASKDSYRLLRRATTEPAVTVGQNFGANSRANNSDNIQLN
ncbi:MAG: hypothetical protein AAGM46_25595 [Cyanobacteria bacterium J06582_2]